MDRHVIFRLQVCLLSAPLSIFTARAYARAVLGVVILSVRLSVRPSVCLSVCLSHAYIVTKLNTELHIFWYHTKGQSLCYSDTKSSWWATPPSLWNLRSKWPTPFEKRRLRPISAHNVSTIGDSEKSSITTNIKSTTGFPTSHRWSAYVTPKSDFFAFEHKSTADRLKRCQLRWPACVINMWWSAAMLFAHRRRRRRDLYSPARPSRRNGLFTIWCVRVNCVVSQWREK